MRSRDLLLSIAAALLTAIFLLPILNNTGLYSKIPFPTILLFGVLPILTVIGMYITSIIGHKIAILWQLAKFGLVGFLNTAIDFGILNFLIALTSITGGIGIIFMNATSFSTAVVNSYFWNKEWVFGARKRGNFITFLTVTLIGLAINTGTVYLLTTYIPPVLVVSNTLWANLAKVLATGLSLIWNFTGYKLIVFKG